MGLYETLRSEVIMSSSQSLPPLLSSPDIPKRKRRNRIQLEYELNEILRLMSLGATNHEICQMLKLPKTTFYRYMQMIGQQELHKTMTNNLKYMAKIKAAKRQRLLRLFKETEKLKTDEKATIRKKAKINRDLVTLTILLNKLETEGSTLFQVIPYDQEHSRVKRAAYLLREASRAAPERRSREKPAEENEEEEE
jgi:hypothetical protein